MGELIATDRPLEDAPRALYGWFTVRVGPLGFARRTYYDTFDGLLYEAGYTLSSEGGVQWLRSRNGLPAEPDLTAEQIAGVRKLLPIAELELSTQTLDVLDEREKIIGRIVVETPTTLRPRLRLVGLRGYDRQLDQVYELLARSEGFVPAEEPLVDEAVRAAGGNPQGVSAKVDVPLQPGERADVAVSRILKRLLEIMDLTLPGTLADTDTEFLHDYRVALRRSRAVVRELRGVFPPSEIDQLRVEFKWLQEVTGQTRDLDVYLMEFEEMRELAPESQRIDLDPLLSVLQSWHLAARQQMERDLVSARARRLRADWGYLIVALPDLSERERPDAARPVAEVAGERIWRVHRRMVKMGQAIATDSLPAEYHELRKKGKELRYLLELFGVPLYDSDVVKPMIRALKGLQDVLGLHQDRDVQVHTLRRLGDHVLAQRGGSAALMAMGALVDRLEADAQSARDHFAQSFAEFASEAQCKLVEKTFKPKAD